MAKQILGNTSVVATTATTLAGLGIDPKRVDRLIPWHSVAVEIDGVVIKKVEPDSETPGNFGLFIRYKLAL